VEQVGPLVLQRNMTVSGAWVPNWWFDTICMEKSVGQEAVSRFGVVVRDVQWHGKPLADAVQMVIPVVGNAWFDHDTLLAIETEEHGTPGRRCEQCGTWRWQSLAFSPVPNVISRVLPPVLDDLELGTGPIVASPEWFGDGWNSFHETLVRRDLAEFLVAASPRDFKIDAVRWSE
jgi:hypothetical protein